MLAQAHLEIDVIIADLGCQRGHDGEPGLLARCEEDR
jgi:hypothetical protein